jgi:four helix bundle protein
MELRGKQTQPPTLNVQRRTSNGKDSSASISKSDFSNLVRELFDWLMRFPIREQAVFAGQLLRSGTSRYGNHGEVEAAESRKDFVHKLKICLKELKETRGWLRLIQKSKMLPEKSLVPILEESEELIRIFFTSIRTAEKNS